jgi:hypothetical protein
MPVWKSITKDNKDGQPTLTQFGYNLAERIDKFDTRQVRFDAMRVELVIDDTDRINILDLYKEFMAQERHRRFPVRQRYLVEWKNQMPVADRTKEKEALASERQEAFNLELKRAGRRREKRMKKDH